MDGDILGLERDEAPSGKFLGRVLTHQPWGIQVEADQKLVMQTNGVDTPGQKDLPEPGEQLMVKADAARFRRGGAQLNDLSQNRLDLSYASKEVARYMANPKVGA